MYKSNKNIVFVTTKYFKLSPQPKVILNTYLNIIHNINIDPG